jgi:drug/metabolite transporter (DMT)-like permease
VLPFVLALLASVSWGVGDFLGGLKSRSLPLLVVLAASQPVGLLTIALVVLIRRVPMPEPSFLPYAIAGGIAVTIGIAAFFRALAVGTMSVVAPISAVGTAVPIIFGLLAGERPGIGQILGIALTTIGVVLVAREPAKPGEAARPMGPGVALAVVAALSFGCFLTAMHEASGEDAYWATLVQRLTTMVMLLVAVLWTRPSFSHVRPHLIGVVAIGLLDMGAALLYSLASSQGMVSLISVMASLYPIVTVLLAHVILGERLALSQRLGAGAAFGGIGLITLA